MGRHGQWWVADESPGGPGEREIWVDESALDMIARGDAAPVTVLRLADGAAPMDWIGATVRFREQPGVSEPVVYRIICRRWSQANAGRPYYVLAWPDLLLTRMRERQMAEPVPEPAEERGGEDIDWASARPGEPLRQLPEPETAGGDDERP